MSSKQLRVLLHMHNHTVHTDKDGHGLAVSTYAHMAGAQHCGLRERFALLYQLREAGAMRPQHTPGKEDGMCAACVASRLLTSMTHPA